MRNFMKEISLLQMKIPALTTLMMRKTHFIVLKEIDSQLM